MAQMDGRQVSRSRRRGGPEEFLQGHITEPGQDGHQGIRTNSGPQIERRERNRRLHLGRNQIGLHRVIDNVLLGREETQTNCKVDATFDTRGICLQDHTWKINCLEGTDKCEKDCDEGPKIFDLCNAPCGQSGQQALSIQPHQQILPLLHRSTVSTPNATTIATTTTTTITQKPTTKPTTKTTTTMTITKKPSASTPSKASTSTNQTSTSTQAPTTEKPLFELWHMILMGVAGAALLAIVIGLVLCCVRKERRKRGHHGHPGHGRSTTPPPPAHGYGHEYGRGPPPPPRRPSPAHSDRHRSRPSPSSGRGYTSGAVRPPSHASTGRTTDHTRGTASKPIGTSYARSQQSRGPPKTGRAPTYYAPSKK